MPFPTSSTDSDGGNVSVAVDLGGTKIIAARIVDGQIIERLTRETDPSVGPEAQCSTIARLIESLMDQGEGPKLGVAVCGRVDRQGRWHATNLATLGHIQGYPIQTELETRFSQPVTVMNDAVAAAWGEYRVLRRRRPLKSLLYLTVSTGVGGGIVLDGRPLLSDRGLAGHLGFMRTAEGRDFCGSGRFGTLESIASGTAIGRYGSTGAELRLTGREVYERHLAGDRVASDAVDQSARAVAAAIADLRALLDIDQVVLGGGIGLADGYLSRVQAHLDAEPELFRPPLCRATLGTDSAVFGVIN